jgi:hypothetical protein
MRYSTDSQSVVRRPLGVCEDCPGGPRYYFCAPVKSWKETNYVLNTFNVLQNLFIRNNGITNILDSKFRTGVYVSYIMVTKPFMSLNDLGIKIYCNGY